MTPTTKVPKKTVKPLNKGIAEAKEVETFFCLDEEGVKKIDNFLAIINQAEQIGAVDYRAAYTNLVANLKSLLAKKEI
jgi:hypothetical protein